MSTTSFVGKAGIVAPRSGAYQMIHLMNMQHSTGKAAYSIPSYSTGLSGWRRISVTAIRSRVVYLRYQRMR